MSPKSARHTPPTEGIKYAGSKLKLLPHILSLVEKTDSKLVLDGFSGTTRVSQALAQRGHRVVSNDISVWSKTLGLCYLKNQKPGKYFKDIFAHLNNLQPIDGWFSRHYGGIPNNQSSIGDDGLKKPFQVHNTRKLDAIRNEIENLNLDEIDKSVLLTSLILALDKVDSTIGHHASYLNKWSARSYKKLELKMPLFIEDKQDHRVIKDDIFSSIDNVEVDLAYFDPPYGSNNEKMPPSRVRYAAYYHLWTSVILNDRAPLFGKAKRRSDSSDRVAASVFEEFRESKPGEFIAVKAIEELLSRTKARFIILSYSSGGRATAESLFEILENSGNILEFAKFDYKRNVMASMRWTNDWVEKKEKSNQEYLFLIEK